MRGIRVEMMGIRGIRLGMRGTGSGNEGNKVENLRIGVELMNYNCGEGQKLKEMCVFIRHSFDTLV